MDAYELTSPQKKFVMWYKCRELFDKGLSKSQISRDLGLNRRTVRKYLSMTLEEFENCDAYIRMYAHKLDPYESFVRSSLESHNDLSASQIYDWLRDKYADYPHVSEKTVYNFVEYVRSRYNIPKPGRSHTREYWPVEETAYGEYAQADFGEMWMRYEDGRRVKVYFFVMVLCRSRKKYVYFNRTPFTAEMAAYAHEKAFEYYGGKPKKIIYDQDAVLLKDENLGYYIMTKTFQAFVQAEHFECIFCRKSDPESKGKVENVVKYVKYNFLRGRTFVSIEQLNEEGVRWLSRTANGLLHHGTHKIPDEVFKEERQYLLPYHGTPMMPERGMKMYKVHKTNTISYRGNIYSLPSGTYKSSTGNVWVDIRDGYLDMYDMETGKQIAHHKESSEKGQYIKDPSHRIITHVSQNQYETKILEYCKHDELAVTWLVKVRDNKPRYYMSALRLLNKEIQYYGLDTLHRALELSLDRGMCNAKDFIALCGRIGKRISPRDATKSYKDHLPKVATERPDKADINHYNVYFT